MTGICHGQFPAVNDEIHLKCGYGSYKSALRTTTIVFNQLCTKSGLTPLDSAVSYQGIV
jgi:hypothetical protein